MADRSDATLASVRRWGKARYATIGLFVALIFVPGLVNFLRGVGPVDPTYYFVVPVGLIGLIYVEHRHRRVFIDHHIAKGQSAGEAVETYNTTYKVHE